MHWEITIIPDHQNNHWANVLNYVHWSPFTSNGSIGTPSGTSSPSSSSFTFSTLAGSGDKGTSSYDCKLAIDTLKWKKTHSWAKSISTGSSDQRLTFTTSINGQTCVIVTVGCLEWQSVYSKQSRWHMFQAIWLAGGQMISPVVQQLIIFSWILLNRVQSIVWILSIVTIVMITVDLYIMKIANVISMHSTQRFAEFLHREKRKVITWAIGLLLLTRSLFAVQELCKPLYSIACICIVAKTV